ncbi:dynamin-2 [Trichonephila clavipes]|nr:dynamin-2 [Trichonephila clavipes]
MKNNSTWYAEVKFKINTQAESVTYGFRRDRPRGSERVDSYAPPTQGKLEPNEEDMTVLITNLHGIRGSISFPSLSLDAVNRKLVTQYEYPLEQSVECIKKVLEEAILESSEMCTNMHDDRAIIRASMSSLTTSLQSFRHLPPSRHSVISKKTIRRLTAGIRNQQPLRRLPLTPHHRQCRLDFCRHRAS